MKRKVLLIGLFALIIAAIAAPSALAADAAITSGGTYDIADAAYGSGSTLTVQTTAAVTFTQSNATTAITGFQIRCTVANADITIDGVNIDNSSNSGTIPIAFNASGCTLTASGINYLTAGYYEPAIRILNSNSLTILGDASSEIHATGGSYGAGIGGGYTDTAGYITISSGTIVATGGTYAAGIGSAYNGYSRTTTINGTADVTATGGYQGAGIGGGYDANVGTINISENAIVTATGGDSAAGIGGGQGKSNGTINISGGTITATGASGAIYAGGAGIGSGSEGNGAGIINISGGTISATSNGYGAGIGGGYSTNGGTINISGGTITNAQGGSYSAGIGGGYYGNAGTINISGGTITNAKGGNYAPGIGTGYKGTSGTIELTGGNITANGGNYASGIGTNCSGSSYNKVTIEIDGATVNAKGGTMAAGIGTGDNSYYKYSNYTTINIIDGTITAQGGDRAAGIGGGYFSTGGKINISGGTITANGRSYVSSLSGAGIGAGSGSETFTLNGGTITISGGTITATGAQCAAGIGGGTYGDGGSITISGGTVFAYGGKGNESYGSGAGIGGGGEGDGGTINISGGRVESKGNYYNDNAGIHASCGIGAGCGMIEPLKTSTISISGGQVFGYSGYLLQGYDIGSFYGTLDISGTAAVFARYGTYQYRLYTYSHTKYTNETITGGMAYGYTVPSDWTGGACAYLVGYTVNYESGVSGSISGVSSETVFYGTSPRNVPTATPASGSSFDGWHDGESIYSNLDTYEVTEPATFTAVFNPTPVTGVTLDITSATLVLGDGDTTNDTIDLDEEISPAYATNQGVAWESSDTSVATVDANGLVAAVAAGNTIITVTTDDGSFTAECNLTVEQRVTGVLLNITSATLILDDADTTNDTVQLTETVVPSDATNKAVTWSSSNASAATVDSNGLITAVGAGNTDITVTTDDGSFTAICAVEVEQSVTGVTLNYSEITMEVGDTAQINCTVEPDDTTDKTTSWSSDNTPVASVVKDTDEQGTVTANAVGVAYITITTNNGGYTDICKVTVVDMTTYAVSKYGGLTGNLLQNDGTTGIENWKVTLYSTPISVTTNVNGDFGYSGVQYSHHTLVFTDDVGAEFDRYTLNFTASKTTGYSVSGDTITVNYTANTTNVDFEFTMNTTGTDALLSDVTFTEQKASNPQTGEKSSSMWIWFVCIMAVLVSLITFAVIFRKNMMKKVIQE